jgi:hypothetical protein
MHSTISVIIYAYEFICWCLYLVMYIHWNSFKFFCCGISNKFWDRILICIFKLKACWENIVIVCVCVCVCGMFTFSFSVNVCSTTLKKLGSCCLSVSSCGVVTAQFRVLGAESGWRRFTYRIYPNKSEVQYCAVEFRTSSNWQQILVGGGGRLHRIVVIAERERPVNFSCLFVLHQ